MKTLIKWMLIIGCGMLVCIVAAAFIIPQFVDVKKYKPTIEQKVSEATGRAFTMGDDMDVSIFPWVGVKLSDIHLGNPKGFGQDDMVAVKKFEVRLKVMPLLSKQIEVKTFVLDSPLIYLEKPKTGPANWEGLAKKGDKPEKKEQKSASSEGLPISSLQVDTFSIINGRLIYKDQAAGIEKEVSDFNLELGDISLDKPVSILFSAQVDGKPVTLEGSAGPIGKEPGKGTIVLDLALNALDALAVKVAGVLVDPLTTASFDMSIDVAAFSPRDLMAALGQPFPVKTADPSVLNAVSVKAQAKGTPKNISISNGQFVLDDSTLDFSASAKEFSKPNLAFDLSLDQIDLDRYLPPASESKQKSTEQPADKPVQSKKKTDYTPLRKLVLDGKIKAGKIKAHGAQVEQVVVHVTARDGVLAVDPFGMKLYQGSVASTLGLDVRANEPKTSMMLKADNIQAGPLLKDALQKEVIEGTLKADLNLSMKGEAPARIKQTLNGKGSLLFNDGAIIGVDIPGMVRNVKSKVTGAETTGEKPKTDFAELNVPFTAKNGLVNTDGTKMVSPLIRVGVVGDINLVKEVLDMRVNPKVVATLKGQGDDKDRSGLMVPLLITGSFASPKIRPDLKGMLGTDGLNADALKQQVLGTKEGLDPEALKQQVLGNKDGQNEGVKIQAEDVQKQLKSLIPGFGQ